MTDPFAAPSDVLDLDPSTWPCVAADDTAWLDPSALVQLDAAARCAGCPVLLACRDRGRHGPDGDPEWGVWGGETTQQRRVATGRSIVK
ncbi:WhiB family transcriptional regulator [Embleya sp. MST-111070]|uniref:WhiB family transcriptional regulator n=1 Tax=Embleya sp. MST-111070 TaxID=3398231 RepID=UPI003F73571F